MQKSRNVGRSLMQHTYVLVYVNSTFELFNYYKNYNNVPGNHINCLVANKIIPVVEYQSSKIHSRALLKQLDQSPIGDRVLKLFIQRRQCKLLVAQPLTLRSSLLNVLFFFRFLNFLVSFVNEQMIYFLLFLSLYYILLCTIDMPL